MGDISKVARWFRGWALDIKSGPITSQLCVFWQVTKPSGSHLPICRMGIKPQLSQSAAAGTVGMIPGLSPRQHLAHGKPVKGSCAALGCKHRIRRKEWLPPIKNEISSSFGSGHVSKNVQENWRVTHPGVFQNPTDSASKNQYCSLNRLGHSGIPERAYTHCCTNTDLHVSFVAHSSVTHVGLGTCYYSMCWLWQEPAWLRALHTQNLCKPKSFRLVPALARAHGHGDTRTRTHAHTNAAQP